MQRVYTIDVGTDTRNTTLPGPTQVAGVRVDNPSGSWLRLAQVVDYVPPYTLGWSRTIIPAVLSLDILWTDSPSGTPSALTGLAATVTLYDTPQPNSQGYASGATEIQTAGIGNIQFRFESFILNETLNPAAATLPPPGIATMRYELLGWQVFASMLDPLYAMRTLVFVQMIDGLGADLFPPAIISPETPVSPWTPPTGRPMQVGAGADIGGFVGPGGGAIGVGLMLKFYLVDTA